MLVFEVCVVIFKEEKNIGCVMNVIIMNTAILHHFLFLDHGKTHFMPIYERKIENALVALHFIEFV